MNDLNVIDRFMAAFIRYIDSGFGLLGGDVRFLTATLIAIDITLAGLFWAMGGDENVLGRLIKKILYVGVFAFILNSFSTLADIIFRSFARAGLTAGGGTIGPDQLLQPGWLASTGFSAAKPLLDEAADMLGFTTFFDNIVPIAVLLFAWAIVILAFFILAVQMFVTVIEFKLTSLAGFILVPFALWNRTAFLAERVLGNVVSSGIKVMVLAVIVGIGSGFFAEFTSALSGREPSLADAMSLVLAALSLFGLGIFGPSIASGLVSGGPQLGAGAALGTTIGAAGATMLAGGATFGAARIAGGAALGAVRAGTSVGKGASTAYALGRDAAATPSVGAGIGAVGKAAGSHAKSAISDRLGVRAAAERGQQAAFQALGGGGTDASSSPGVGGAPQAMPDWARRFQHDQAARHHRHTALQTLKEGDRGGAAATPDIKERDE